MRLADAQKLMMFKSSKEAEGYAKQVRAPWVGSTVRRRGVGAGGPACLRVGPDKGRRPRTRRGCG